MNVSSEQIELLDEGATGLEQEDTSSESSETEILQPFDPSLIRVEMQPMTVSLLLSRVSHNEINLQPGFQRKAGIWTLGAQSRLIESLLIRIPIPAFYMDGTDDDQWLVVDGLQRLTALKHFVLDRSLHLMGLEFLHDLNGKTFDKLARNFQRRIEETQITVFVIQENTPAEVKYNVFKRINTGGLPLSAQEIRHALYPGRSADLLKELAASKQFQLATAGAIRDDRMGDRECILRALAFMIFPPETYRSSELDTFLNKAIQEINSYNDQKVSNLRQRFLKALDLSRSIFGKHAFRKHLPNQNFRSPINKAIFETWVVAFSKLTDSQAQESLTKKATISSKFSNLLLHDQRFVSSVSIGTGDVVKIRYRFQEVTRLLMESINA
jgi:hypothetical protein